MCFFFLRLPFLKRSIRFTKNYSNFLYLPCLYNCVASPIINVPHSDVILLYFIYQGWTYLHWPQDHPKSIDFTLDVVHSMDFGKLEKEMATTPVFLPGEPHGWGAWWATVHGVPRFRHDLATKPSPWSHISIISIQIILTGLKNPLCGLCSFFLPPLPHNQWSFLCLQHFAFSRSHMGFSLFRVILSYINMHLSFFYIFSWLNSLILFSAK